MESPRFADYRRRIAVLQRRLPRQRALGDYAPIDFDRVRAFRLLAHAEMESCIEDLARNALIESMKRYRVDGKPRKPLVAVVAYFARGSLPKSHGEAHEDFESLVNRAVQSYVAALKSSNGVREKDLLGVLLPVGLTDRDLDPVWLAEMDSFGQGRGDVAHQSFATQRQPDPARERDVVIRLTAGIRDVDRKLLHLVSGR